MAKAAHPDLQLNQHYIALLHELESIKPLAPAYDWHSNNIEEMKYRSAQSEMYNLMMKLLKPHGEQ